MPLLRGTSVKYFFLANGWTTGRVWEFGGLWNWAAWQRSPHLEKQSLCIREGDEVLRLYQAEDAVLMVEVVPLPNAPEAVSLAKDQQIGQVVLKRLLSAEQAMERLCDEETIFHAPIE